MPVKSPFRMRSRSEMESLISLILAQEFERDLPEVDESIAALSAVQLARNAGIEPDPWQRDFLGSKEKSILLNCSRQSGKSTMAAVKAVHGALYEPRSLTLLLSPGLRQSGELFAKCREIYAAVGKPVLAESETALQMRLENGSRIVSLPGNMGRIRGFSGPRRVFIDEAAWVPDDLYRSVRPMLAVSQGDLIVMSTPWGRRGFFYESWIGSLAGEQQWQRFEVTAEDCPRIPADFLEEERKVLPEEWFLSEYMCQFTSSSATVFNADWYAGGRGRYVLGGEDEKERRNHVVARWLMFDTAMKDKDSSDYTACVELELTKDYRLQVTGAWRERLRFPDLIARIEHQYRLSNWDGKLHEVVIEDKVSGTSAYQTLVASTREPQLARRCVAFNPGAVSIRQRAMMASAWCRNESVMLPAPSDAADWLSMFERELFGFTGTPQDEHDDLVAAFVQGILFLEQNGHILSNGLYAREGPHRKLTGAGASPRQLARRLMLPAGTRLRR